MNDQHSENVEYVRIIGLENAFEAQLMASILLEREIPHRIRSHHDTAYDGLYQMQKGWGDILAPEPFRDDITEILRQIRLDSEKADQ